MITPQQQSPGARVLDAGSPAGLMQAQADHWRDQPLLVLPASVAALWPDERAIWTYEAMAQAVTALAARYADAGYGPGHRVALLLENRPSHFLHWLAVNRCGASVVPVNPDYRDDERLYLLTHSEACLIVALPERAAQIATSAQEADVVLITPNDALPPAPTVAKAAGRGDGLDAECALIYTSGTTSRPKGCILSNRYFLNWAWWYGAQRGAIALRPGQERLMTPFPTFHVNAMGHSFMGMLGAGGAQIILDRFHPRSWWQTAAETGATCFHYLGVIPAILLELPESADDRAHRMRFGLGGGVHPEHHARFETRFGVPLLEGWAMTETGGAGTLCACDDDRHVGSRCIGRPDRPGPAIQVRLVDDAGRAVPAGEPGELLLRATGDDPRRGFFSGYLKDAQATDAAWRGGWLHTGDVMRQGSDGALHFVDRRKNIIRRSGENIAAVEVETVIAGLPGVGQVAVLAMPDPLREEEVLAVVEPAPDCDRAALAESVFEACARDLAYYKVPGVLTFVDAMPTTTTQKIRKAALREIAQAPIDHPGAIDWRDRKAALRGGKP
ncbi:MAG: crotonobetaine/carnitine-CoA ligase [Rhodobacteraceae bacterium HLUCCA12]|nr:MAG: crotonobetaine/carnitine-CoA ligase [Rhodobacteraceae bacterium HLUCCA12]